MFPFPSKPESRPTFEDIFFKHHVRLNEWALQLTGGDRSDAEDLVQELYVRFAGVGPVGEHIEDPEDYLFSVLRNLHFARIRRARTSAIDDLSLVDYDSAERGLRAVDRNEILFIREDLHRVCDYLCERKNTSRSASIFILRYFLGYYPNEVMKVVQSTRVAVDKAIQAARREARLDLERPGVLQQIGSGRDSKPRISKDLNDSHGLFLALRTKVFRSCIGVCFKQAFLEEKYAEPQQSFTTTELAHLVSCPECLDRANRLLGLPLLKERSPDETIGRNTPQGPDSPSSAPPTLVSSRPKRKSDDPQRLRKRMKRYLEEVNQHRPQRLLIAVDGDIRASQKVTAPFSELRAELRPMEKPTFIEVLSEQGICVGFVLIQTLIPESGLQQVKELQLSDDRMMKIVVSFIAESPTVQVIYSDPLVAQDAELDEDTAETLQLDVPHFASVSIPLIPWRNIIAELPGRPWRRISRILSLKMNPLLASAMLFGLCSIICFLLWMRSGPRISAGTILSRAEQSDASVAKAGHPEIIYQKVRITGSGHAMERPIYRDPQKKRRLKQQHLSPDDQWLKDKLNMAGVDWDEPLSAANYKEWHDRLPTKQDVVTRAGSNLLTLTTSTNANGSVLKESLTVRESDFHPLERTIELRDVGEVEVAELNYDVMPWGAVNQGWFEPLVGQTVSDAPIHAAIHLPHLLSDLELDEAELSARTILNQLHADTGESIHLTRAAAGIEIKGVVDTDARKHELLSHLAPLPNVHSSILSEEEVATRPPSQPIVDGGQPIEVHSVEGQPSPLEQYLREKKLPTDQLAAISHDLLDGSLRISQVEVHLSELQPRFKEVNQLPIEMQSQLATLSHTYLGIIEASLDANNHTLLSLGFNHASRVSTTPESSDPDGDIDEQIRDYRQLCLELIMNGTAQSRPAPAIVEELINTSERIRRHLARMSATVPGNPN